ncbi:AcvB/VirJ family lysyl-phosphatidylglycerol hydrolase [Gilliamella sp. Nev3-1]|uniref:AcvB/VirJ family lysyl-phosphatidylglycerol hydrolase n=1 Tax=Gilliamella sp. Nev3-1 TaxID=3120250 RepID=UPI00080E334B|nr:AcvB/VirJ family lysyl-phosphatidylglycerol hydrolase [Gilliamella apicola]OCG61000.1 hypothetical protein A9G40_02730 [Gilliamella apicola]
MADGQGLYFVFKLYCLLFCITINYPKKLIKTQGYFNYFVGQFACLIYDFDAKVPRNMGNSEVYSCWIFIRRGNILPALYNRLSTEDQKSVQALVMIAFSKNANFEIEISGWLGQSGHEMKTAPEINNIPASKLFCIYGEEEINDTGCLQPEMKGETFRLPSGHHFDENYEHLGKIIMDAIDKRM